MSQVTSRVTAALAGIVLASLPLVAQSTNPPPQQPDTRSQQPSRSSADDNSPPHHLSEARRVLNTVDVNSLKGETRTLVSELRTHFQQLDQAWLAKSMGKGAPSATGHAGGHTEATTGATGSSTSGTATAAGTAGTPEQAGATGASRQSPRAGSPTASPSGTGGEWTTHYKAIDDALTKLLGNTGATAGASTKLDATTRTKLQDFRKHLEQFRAAAIAEGGVSQEYASGTSLQREATASAAQAAASTSMGATPQSGGSSSTTQTGQSSHSTHTQPTTNTDVTSQPPAQAASATPVTIDSATIGRLVAQIDTLVGSASTSSTSSSTATTGAVGTSGTTAASVSGTVCVDRAKLEQLKRDLQALQGSSQRQ